jgi:hypothetical protein
LHPLNQVWCNALLIELEQVIAQARGEPERTASPSGQATYPVSKGWMEADLMKFVKKLQKCDIALLQAGNSALEPCAGIAVAIAMIVT